MDTDAEFARMVIEEDEREAEEKMAGLATFKVGGVVTSDGTVTMTEFEWLKLFRKASVTFQWAANVVTWHDMERIIGAHVGWNDDNLGDADRRRTFFDEGVSRTDAWREPEDQTFHPILLAASVLAEMGYFEGPEPMAKWVVTAMENESKFMQLLDGSED